MACSSSGKINIFEQVIHKIPGNTAQFKKDKQGYVDFELKNNSDLLEMIERQNKLLNNKPFINKLPDKGAKIINYKRQLEEELARREKKDDLSNMLNKLNINGKEALDKLEWNGNCNPGRCKFDNDVRNMIQDEHEKTDPLKIFATHSGTVHNQKITRFERPEVPLISSSVIEQLEDSPKEETTSNESYLKETDELQPVEDQLSSEELYIKQLCDKFDSKSTNKAEKFLPHRTLKHPTTPGTSKCTKEQTNRKARWEVTAATPPPSVYNDVKLISLDDSVKLQLQQAEKLQEVQLKHATERLRAKSTMSIGDSNLKFTGKSAQLRNPRQHIDSSDSSDNDDDESYHSCNEEEDDADEKGGVVTIYNLIDD